MLHLSTLLLISVLNLFHPFSYPRPRQPLLLVILTVRTHLGTLTALRTNLKKICLTGFSPRIYYLSITQSISLYCTALPKIAPPLICLLFLPQHLIAYGRSYQILALLTSLFLLQFLPYLLLIQPLALTYLITYNKARWDEYFSYIDIHCSLSLIFSTLFLTEATHTFTKLLNERTYAITFGNVIRSAKARWFPEIAEAVAKRGKAFAKAHCFEEDPQNYISIIRYTSTVISKAKAESWSKTCSSFSPKTRSSEVFSLLCSPIFQVVTPPQAVQTDFLHTYNPSSPLKSQNFFTVLKLDTFTTIFSIPVSAHLSLF